MKTKLLLITLFSVLFSFGQVPASERNALIALYNATDGPNWNSNTNWGTSEPVSSWSNVEVVNGHVVKLTLAAENLTGTLPNEMLNLSFLEVLHLGINSLSGLIPNLTGLANLSQLTINDNYYQFDGFENEFSTYINYDWFLYSPMKKIATEDVYDIVYGTNYTFTMPSVSGTGVTYQWYKNGDPISGATSLTYTITNAQASDAADYTCKASSSIVTNLTIDRNTIHLYDTVLTSDRNALIALYNATDGANWTNNTNWNTSAPIRDWYGVSVIGTRVTAIELGSFSGNNLNGTLPTEIGDLTELTNLNLQFNSLLTGNIPTSIGSLVKLKDLNFWNTNLTGTIPTEIGNLTNLETITLENNNLTGDIPTSFANLTKMTSFWLNGNQLTGDVSNLFVNMPDLYYVSLGESGTQHQAITGGVDLSNNTNLHGVWMNELDLTSIDVRNGNNALIAARFYTINNPNLTCVFVDDANYSTTTWTQIDATTTFVETQAACDALGISDMTFEEDIVLYPNPNAGILHIRNDGNSSINRITILNTLGQKVMDRQSVNSIDMTSLPNGMYYVNIENTKGNKASYKIIKK